MARLLLDSTVLIDVLHGYPAVARVMRFRRDGVEPWACAISVAEYGRLAGGRGHEGATAL